MTIIHHDTDFKIEKIDNWIRVNGSWWGFLMTSDTGVKYIVRHVRRLGMLSKEYGFYVPRPLLKLNVLFEVHLAKTYAQYQYLAAYHQRLVKTPPEVFVSLARLEFTKDAAHIVRPRPPRS